MADAERLEAWRREAEGFQQAFRLAWAQHDPARLWKEYQGFLSAQPAAALPVEDVRARAARHAQAAAETWMRHRRQARRERHDH